MSGDHNQYQKANVPWDKLPPFPKAERIEAVQFCDDAYWFSADQMREYGELCRQQALEEAAQRAKEYIYKRTRDGQTANGCHDAIRSLK